MFAERSNIWVPSNNQRFVETIWTRDADVVILDLEASVPDDQQGPARDGIRDAIPKVSKGGASVTVRVNHRQWKADLDGGVWPGVFRIICPQPETAEKMRLLDQHMALLERLRGIPLGSIEIYPLVETVRGVANAYEIATASPRIKIFSGGSLGFDTCRDLLIENRTGGTVRESVYYMIGECALAARAAGRQPKNGVGFDVNLSGDVTQADASFRSAETNRKAGIYGVGGGLHPNVIEPSNRGQTPTQEEVAEAREVIKAFERLDAQGQVSGVLNGKVVDRWEAERARKLLAWADACDRQERWKQAVKAMTLAQEKSGG